MSTMPHMTLENIIRVCKGTYFGDTALLSREISGAVMDSRQIEEGFLFFPIRGERVDGHDFIPMVFEKGALATLSERELENAPGPYILVDSTTEAMKRMAAFYRESLDIKVVGISGSVGKTSTKEMIASVLEQKYKVLKTAGNYNNEIGLPLTIFRIRQEHEVAVLEMGISDFHEMHRLAAMAQPDVSVITNIGLCHLENLGTRDGILQAKTEMFEHMPKGGTVILNGDDDKLCTRKVVNGKPTVFYGIQSSGLSEKRIYATDIENLGFEGMKATIHTPQGEMEVLIPIPGEHNVYNALAAASVGLELGESLEQIQAGIESAKTIAGRTNFIHTKGMIVIDDCYNANPVSMEAALDILSHSKGRSIAVLGDMGELGTNEVALHKGVGKIVAQKGIDVLFCAGNLAKEYAKEAQHATDVHYFENREDMTEALVSFVREGDSILVKASHFMEFPKVVEALTK